MSDTWIQVLFAAVIVVLGLVAAFKGELKVGPQDASDEEFKHLPAATARKTGVAIVLSGIVFAFSPLAGMILLAVAVSVAWLFG